MHTLLTQIPSIAEEKIKIDLEKHSTSVTIVASDTTIQNKKVIPIPCEVRFRKNGYPI
jgi:hypothetical protein